MSRVLPKSSASARRSHIILSRVKSFCVSFTYFIAGTLLSLLMRAVKPFLHIRVGNLLSDRLGHFAANTEIYLCEQEFYRYLGGKDYFDFFRLSPFVCNDYLLLMWKRSKKIRILPRRLVYAAYLSETRYFKSDEHIIPDNLQNDRDILGLFEEYPPQLRFTKEEHEIGRDFLSSIGLNQESRFVCLTVRDSTYLQSTRPEIDWSYHNYRDSRIEEYIEACEMLADMGYFVFRMGAAVEKPLLCSNPHIIDYAYNGMRSEFLDLYLGAHCEFCITQATGFDAIPTIFRRPLLQVNAAPIGNFYTWGSKFNLVIPKHVIDLKSGKYLSISEQRRRNLCFVQNSHEFKSLGVGHVDNSSGEITEAVFEMVERLNGRWFSSEEDLKLQEKLWEKFPKDAIDEYCMPYNLVINARVGARFLSSNPYYLE